MEVVSSNPSQATSFLSFSTKMITFVLCNIFELILYSEFILTEVVRTFAKYTFGKLLTFNLNFKDNIDDLSITVEGLSTNIQDNSAKIEETEDLAQNLVDQNYTISVKMHETETLVQSLNNTVNYLENSFDENQAKIQKNEEDLNVLQENVYDLNNTVMNNSAKIKGIYLGLL